MNKVPVTQEITLDELVQRVRTMAERLRKHTPDRLLLLNTAAALETLGKTVQQSHDELLALRAKHYSKEIGAPRIVLGGGLHRVN